MVDIQPTTTQPISDDQELAKVLAGVSQQGDDVSMQFEETPSGVADPAPVVEETPAIEPAIQPMDPITPAVDPVPATGVTPAGADDRYR